MLASAQAVQAADSATPQQVISAVSKGNLRALKALDLPIQNLSAAEKSQLVNDLAPYLDSQQWQQQCAASHVCGVLGPAAASLASKVLNAMDAKMENVAWEAAPAVGKMGPPALQAAAVALKEAAKTFNGSNIDHHMLHLVKALGEAGPAAAPYSASIVPFLDNGYNTGAVEALKRIGPAAAYAVCDGLATDNKGIITVHACPVLESFGAPAATALGKLMKGNNELARKNASYVLSHTSLGKSSTPESIFRSLKDADATTVSNAVKTLKAIGPSATPDLVELLPDSNKTTVSNVLDILSSYGPRAKQAMPALNSLMKNGDLNARLAAASTVLSIDSHNTPAANLLIQSLSKGADVNERIEAARQIARAGSAASACVSALIGGSTDSSPIVRAACATALGAIGPSAHQAVKPLLTAATSNHPAVRSDFEAIGYDSSVWSAAIQALGKIGPAASEAVPTLAKMLADPNKSALQSEILRALLELGPSASQAVPDLVKLLDGPAAKEPILSVLKAMGPKAKPALPAIQRVLDNPRSSHDRLAAFDAIISIETDPARRNEYVSKALTSSDSQLKSAALKMAASQSTSLLSAAQIDQLIRGLSDSNYQVRMDSLNALVKVGPRATAALPLLLKENIGSSYNAQQRALAFQAIKNMDPDGKLTIPLIQPNLNDPFKVRSTVELLEVIGSTEASQLAKATRERWKLTR